MIPGEWLLSDEPIEINAGRRTVQLSVTNKGDRPIQVGSHFHFYEVNRALEFDREAALGMRLEVPAGQSIRFEAGDERDVDLVEIGAGTEVISGEGLVATAGAVDTHVHFLTPDQVPHALSNGVTTLIGGGTGPADGSRGTTCTPGPWNLARMLEATAELPVNVGLLGKGNSSRPESLAEQIEAGACGLKVHEDWGATPAALDCALSVADEYDVQVALHADTLNESGYLADTIEAINGRTIHSYHTEGAGGGHAPDVMAIASLPNVLPSSTNPTRPYTTDTTDNIFWMTVITHHLNPSNPEDVAFAQSRIRAETQAAEDVLHDLGALSMYSSDSQAMGRIGDTVTTCWRTADKMKKLTGSLDGDPAEHDNGRILRYLAKLTINPALTHGKAQMVRNSATPEITVDPEAYQVSVDGRPVTVPAADEVAMSQLYYIV